MMYPLVALKRVCCWAIAWLAVALTWICDFVYVAELISLLPLGSETRCDTDSIKARSNHAART